MVVSNLDVVVAVGPDTIKFLSDYADTLFSDGPNCHLWEFAEPGGKSAIWIPRFTGTWQKLEPGKTLEAALRLFPNTRHVFVVGGSSAYDRVVMAVDKRILQLVPDKSGTLLSR